MKPAFDQWPAIRKQIEQAECVCLCLDYDGTLTPIVETPDKAVMPEEMRGLIQRLTAAPACRVSVISGRELGDLKEKVKLKTVTYIGNHGFEIEGEDIQFHSLAPPRARAALVEIKAETAKLAVQFPGIFIEDKGATLSIHYRSVDSKSERLFIGTLGKMVRPYLDAKELRLVEGKKVFELRPPIPWDKGKAILWYLKQLNMKSTRGNILPVYIGDDTTDEDAFSDLKGIGVTIVVGEKKDSHAQYFLKDTDEVHAFLSNILKAVEEKAHAD